jgi:hypothetical protein
MSLAPTASVTLGNLRYDAQLVELWCHTGLLPDVGRCRVVLPAAVRFEAAPGDDAEVVLDGGDSGGPGASATVLTGAVRAVRRSARVIEVVVADAGSALARLRPGVTYTDQDGAAVVRALAGLAGVDIAEVDIDLDLAFYVADQRRTAAEHVAAVAGLAGGIALVGGDGGLQVRTLPGGQADSALLWGRELTDYRVREWTGPGASPVAVGFGDAGSTSDPAVLRPGTDPLSVGAPDPGADAEWIPTPVLRVPSAVQAATRGLGDRQASGATRVEASGFLLPTLRPGAVVEVHDTPGGLDAGPWLLTGVTHRLRPGTGGSTTFTGEKAGVSGGGPGGLLAAAAGALGSLL